MKGNPPIQAEEKLVKGYPITCEALPRQKLRGSIQFPGGSAGPSGLRREQTGTGRAETDPATFLDPGGRSREAQRSGFSPWKRSFCASGRDRDRTVSCRWSPAPRFDCAYRPRRTAATKLAHGMVRWIDGKVKRKLAQGIVRWSRWKGQTARFLIFVGDPAL